MAADKKIADIVDAFNLFSERFEAVKGFTFEEKKTLVEALPPYRASSWAGLLNGIYRELGVAPRFLMAKKNPKRRRNQKVSPGGANASEDTSPPPARSE